MKKAGEIRIPNALLLSALREKKINRLRFFATTKLHGHVANVEAVCNALNIHSRTGSRIVKQLLELEWIGCDGPNIFPRAWTKLKIKLTRIRRGLYLTATPKNKNRFEALCFAAALKRTLKGICRKKGSPKRSTKGGALQSDFPSGIYLAKALGLKERRFKFLKAQALRYRYISVTPRFNVIGTAANYRAIKKNLHGVPVFRRGKKTVVPETSKIKVLI